MNFANLKHDVLDAFSAIERPERPSLVVHSCCECHALAEDLARHSAASLPAEVLQKHVWNLPLLSDEAKQYFLPAWICSSIDDPCSDATDALLMEFRSDHRWSPATAYTEAQWGAIGNWLDLLAQSCDPYSREDLERVYVKLKPKFQLLRAIH